jgi:hypothetical protein
METNAPLPNSPVLFPYPAPPVLPLPARLSVAPEYGDVSAWRSKRNSSLGVGAVEAVDLFPARALDTQTERSGTWAMNRKKVVVWTRVCRKGESTEARAASRAGSVFRVRV